MELRPEQVNRILYFHPEDAAVADSLARITNQFLRDEGVNVELQTRDLSDRYEAPEGQLEIWVSPN